MVDAGSPVDSASFLAALPVGASKAIWLEISSGLRLWILIYNLVMAFMMVVFPVPGPPVIMEIRFSKAFLIASNCSLL